MKTIISKFFLSLVVILSVAIVFNSCKKDEDDEAKPGTQKTKISEWSGTFTGNVEDGTLEFILYSDNSITLSWDTPNACCNSSTGTYTLNGSNFSFTISGSATSGPESSTFLMSSTGSLNTGSGSGTYTIDFTGQGWEDQSGSWNVSTSGAQFASLTVHLNLPADAEGKIGIVCFDDDLDIETGITYTISGPCPSGTSFSVQFDDVPAGSYYLLAAVWVANQSGDLGPGDYLGVYGVSSLSGTFPAEPNAIVPASGTKTFTIDLFVITNKSSLPIASFVMEAIEISKSYSVRVIK
jgi:hypothetical protein